MNKETKEILDYLKISDKNKFGFEQGKLIDYEEVQTLLDYITKLQQENDSLKKQINERKKLDRMRFNMVMSHYGIVKESEEMKTIE